MNRYNDAVKAIRAITAWGCWLGLSWWMVVEPGQIDFLTIIIWLLFFVFSFGMGISSSSEKPSSQRSTATLDGGTKGREDGEKS